MKIKKIVLFFIMEFIVYCLNAQLELYVNYGFVHDFYKVEKQTPSPLIVTSWDRFTSKFGFPGEQYRTLELRYRFKANQVGVLYDFSEYFSEYCFDYLDGITCNLESAPSNNPLNIALTYSRQFKIIQNFLFIPSIGLGIKKFNDVGYLDENKKLLSEGSSEFIRTDNSYYFKIVDKSYINTTTFFIPLDLKLDYKFNSFLHFNLNTKYIHTLNDYINKIDLEYSENVNFTNVEKAIVKNGRFLYIGLGLSIEINSDEYKKLEKK